MTAYKALARATAPFDFFEPRLFGLGWLKELEAGFVPDMEVFEKNNLLTIRLDAPGLKKEELTVNVADGVLAVEGERKHETEEEENRWYRRERTYGRFYRTVPLPAGVNAKDVKATFKDGVLEVTVPVRASAPPAPHKVEVHEPEEKVTVAA
jgi:HSP20 family protein